MLTAADVTFGYPQRPTFLGPISLRIDAAQVWAIVGPNGAGKSTLLRLLAGLHAPHAGRLDLEGRSLRSYSRRQRAQRIAFVPQRTTTDLDLCVREIVLMGRFPHRSLGLFESAEDLRVANEAMAETASLAFADRALMTLSGGEAQRVHIAAALAQQPRFLLLDEPTASLDLRHERAIFELLRRQAREQGVGVVVVIHDLNLAADFCSHVLLLDDGRQIAAGAPAEVLQPQRLSEVYGVDLASVPAPGSSNRRWLIPTAAT